MRDDAVKFSLFSAPMQEFISSVADEADDVSPKYFVSSADARIVDGARSKNPRYLQVRPDLSHPWIRQTRSCGSPGLWNTAL